MGTIRNFVSRFSGIIRLVIFIILVGLIIFFGVRFIRNRQVSNRAEQAVQTAQNDTKKDEEQKSESKPEEPPNSGSNSSNAPLQTPSGINDNQQPANASPTTIPQTGSGTQYLIIAFLLSVFVYLVALSINLRIKRDQL